MLELVVVELLRDADAGLDLALRWLSALAVAHCRPRPRVSSEAGTRGLRPAETQSWLTQLRMSLLLQRPAAQRGRTACLLRG